MLGRPASPFPARLASAPPPARHPVPRPVAPAFGDERGDEGGDPRPHAPAPRASVAGGQRAAEDLQLTRPVAGEAVPLAAAGEIDDVGGVARERVVDHEVPVGPGVDLEPRVRAGAGPARAEVDERQARELVPFDPVARQQRAVCAVEDDPDARRDFRGLYARWGGVGPVVVLDQVAGDAVVGLDPRLPLVDHVDDDPGGVADGLVVAHADMAAVLDLEPDLAIGGAVVVDEDTLALPDVGAGVGLRARGAVAPQAAVRRAHGKHRIGEVPPRGVVAEAEAIDARQVDAETGEPLDREAAQLEPPEAPAAVAARGQLVVG